MSYFKNKSIWFWGFMLLLLINLSIIGSMGYFMYRIHQQPNYSGFHHRFMDKKKSVHGMKTKMLIKELHLSPEQKKQMGKIRKAHFQEMKQLKMALRQNQHNLFDEASKEQPDSASLAQYRKQNLEIQSQITDESLAFFQSIRENLDTEQQEILKEHYQRKFNNRTPK